MKYYLFFICPLIFNITIAQEKVSSIPVIIDKKMMLFEIVDTKSKELLLYQRDKDISTVLKTNDKLEVIDTLNFQTPNPLIFDQYLGHSKKNENYSVYWSNNKRDSIFYQQIDFNADELKIKTILIDFKKEILLESVTVGSNFYFITITKKENSLNFYEFNEGEYRKKTIDFVGENFYHSKDKITNNIWDVFNDGFVGLQTITDDVLVSLTKTQILKKLYILNDKDIVFTFDGNAYVTQILKINIDDYSYSLQNCKKSTKAPRDEYEKLSKTNSFICNDKIFQINSNSDSFVIDIKNFKFETLKSYRIDKDKEIDFINSEVFVENAKITNKKALSKSSKFINNINGLNLGLTTEFKDGKYYLTFGGLMNVSSDSMIYGGMFGAVGALVAVSLSPSYSSQSINSYSGMYVVYTNSILDENLDYVKDTLKVPTFDKVRQFMFENNTLQNQMVFKFDQITYFGGYDKTNKLLTFYKFND